MIGKILFLLFEKAALRKRRMTNKELQELLKGYSDDLPIIYAHPTKNLQTIDYLEERTIWLFHQKNDETTDVLALNFSTFKY